jgi:hypothetical protein
MELGCSFRNTKLCLLLTLLWVVAVVAVAYITAAVAVLVV